MHMEFCMVMETVARVNWFVLNYVRRNTKSTMQMTSTIWHQPELIDFKTQKPLPIFK